MSPTKVLIGQILVVRSIAGLVMLSPFIRREGWGAFRDAPRPPVQWLLRPAFATIEVAAFYWALFYMSLADVMTFYLAGPIYVTAMSPLLLGEKVGWRRWLAVLAGFAGAAGAAGFATALAPGFSGAAAGFASSSAMMRRIDARISSIEGSWTFAGCVMSNSTSSTPSPASLYQASRHRAAEAIRFRRCGFRCANPLVSASGIA